MVINERKKYARDSTKESAQQGVVVNLIIDVKDVANGVMECISVEIKRTVLR